MGLCEGVYMSVGNRLEKLREAKGWTVNKLSNMAGLSQSFVRDIELNEKQPTVESLEYLCDALGITIKDFFDDGVISTILEDETIKAIYTLSQSQRKALLEFIKTLEK